VTAKKKSNVSALGVVLHYELPNWKDQGEDFGEQWTE